MTVSNIVIHKRTFEGVTDPAKNSNPITSKYYPSKKFAVSYDIEGYGQNPVIHTMTTKKAVESHIAQLRIHHEVKE